MRVFCVPLRLGKRKNGKVIWPFLDSMLWFRNITTTTLGLIKRKESILTHLFSKALLIAAFLFSSPLLVKVNARTLSEEVVILVNRERAKLRLRPVTGNYNLARVAYRHASDMSQRNYFSHRSLDGRTLGDRLRQGGIRYSYAGENIAKGQRTSARVMSAWMNSPGHRRNILSRNFGRIGVAKVGNVWVQNFSNY